MVVGGGGGTELGKICLWAGARGIFFSLHLWCAKHGVVLPCTSETVRVTNQSKMHIVNILLMLSCGPYLLRRADNR